MTTGDPVAGVRTTLAPGIAAPDGSATCPRSPPAAGWPVAVCAHEAGSDIEHSKPRIAKYKYFLAFIFLLPFLNKCMKIAELRFRTGPFLLRCIAPWGAAQTPGCQHHRLAGAGGSLQNRFDPAKQSDGGRSGVRTLGCHNQDGIPLMQVRQRH